MFLLGLKPTSVDAPALEMAAEQNKVTLYGTLASPHVKRWNWPVKGIPYEFEEVDLSNKSSLFLKLNPVHKKVHVLVHNGKAIAESVVIIEYIDDTWKTGPQLRPEDPYKRSQIRFWTSYIQQVLEAMLVVIKTAGEVQEKAIEEVIEKLKYFEEGLKGLFPDGIPSSVDEYSKNVTLQDLVMLSQFGGYQAQEEALGVKLIDPEKHPVVVSCIATLIKMPAMKEAIPPHEEVVAFLKFFRENALKSATV